MGARDLLEQLDAQGLTVAIVDDRLMVRPASRLTDSMRDAIRGERTSLVEVIRERARRPMTLSKVEAERAHLDLWNDAAIERFLARARVLRSHGLTTDDAGDLAERLHLRDVEGDDRAMCFECVHMPRGTRCTSPALRLGDVGQAEALRLKRCPEYQKAKPQNSGKAANPTT